jgi:hypothetical protein
MGSLFLFFLYADCFCIECVLFFFHIAFALLKSQLKDFHSTALDCVLFGVLYKIRGFCYRTILHH